MWGLPCSGSATKSLGSFQAFDLVPLHIITVLYLSRLQNLYQNAKAFLYASVNEDFGMVPVEAMAYGTPVVAYASGGVLETVIDGKTGYLYHDLKPEAVIEAVKKIETATPTVYKALQEQAIIFASSCSKDTFIGSIKDQVQKYLQTK